MKGGIEEVAVEYAGDIVNYNVAPLTIALIKGLLTPILNANINYINAPFIAKERNIRVVESKTSEVKDFTSMISVTIKTTEEKSYAAGAIFGKQDARIVRIEKFSMEVIPEGHMIVLYNNDKPGVIGNLGTTLGNNGINIARFQLSREHVDGKALVVLSTDTVVPEDILKNSRTYPTSYPSPSWRCKPARRQSMANVVIIGTQWGDEGKGKIVDLLTGRPTTWSGSRAETMPGIRWW